jgi:Holliday junction resolvasome RuvABC ATP-dependent DNA helicase subunit
MCSQRSDLSHLWSHDKRRRTRPPGALSPALLLDGPFLGRTTELSLLIKAYHSAHHGQTQVVLLQGEAGIGKTRLAKEFLAWAEFGPSMRGAESRFSVPVS